MSDYDAFRKVIEHEANQDDDGGFFAKLGGIEAEHDDGPTAKGLFQHMHRDNGGKLPAGLTTIRNTTGRDIPIYAAKPGQVQAAGGNVIPVRSWNPALGQYPPWYAIRGGEIRTCKVWKKQDYDIFVRPNKWLWHCRLCNYQESLPTWNHAYKAATHHAHNHHRSQ